MGRNSGGVRGGGSSNSNGSREIIKDLSGFDERETRTVKWLTDVEKVPSLKGNMEISVVHAMRSNIYGYNKTPEEVIKDVKNGKIDIERTFRDGTNTEITMSIKGTTKLDKKQTDEIPSGKGEAEIILKVKGRVVRKEKRKFEFY